MTRADQVSAASRRPGTVRTTSVRAGTVRSRSDSRRYLRYWREYLSVSPFFVLFIAFGVVPLFYAIHLSTISWDGVGDPIAVGLEQVVRAVTGGEVAAALGNTMLIFLLGQIPVILGALVGAALLSQPTLRFRSFYQTTFFLPQVTSLVAVAIVFQSIFSNQYGLINQALHALGLPAQQWLSDPTLMKLVIAAMIIWRGFGYFLIVFMAGMAAIDTTLYEAARVDGAGPLRIFRSMTLPLLAPTVVFVSLTGTIAGLQIFTEPQVLFNGTGGPNNGAMTLMLLQYQYLGGVGSGQLPPQVRPDLGFASVIGWVVFLLLCAIAVLNRRVLTGSLTKD